MKTYQIKTFGCQMNHSDSERVASLMEKSGFKKSVNNDADLFIANTCSVRQKAEDKAYGFILKWKKEHPEGKIALTGCMVRQTGDKSSSKDKLLTFDHIDMVFRIEDTARLPKLLENHFPDHDFSDFANTFGNGSLENYFKINPKVKNRIQVFVPIMQGCDKFCSYCIVPYTRGRELSRPMDEIYEECKKLILNGALEITLLGQNVNSYTDGGNATDKRCFAELLQNIDTLSEFGLSRLRFTSAHPQDFTDDVIETLATIKTACPYIHLPVQHGSNGVLRAMNRNYSIEQYNDIIKNIRKKLPNLVLATDIIIGFPGETDDQFQELCDFAADIKFDFSYTAIFSARRNTPAARMQKDFIPMKTKKQRFHAFDQVVKKHAWNRLESFVNTTLEVLVEKSEKNPNGTYKNMGRSREFFEVWFTAGRPFLGKEVLVEITERKGYVLYGRPEESKDEAELRVL